jgi:imidazolonepropionase-like amidohydrolase
MATEAGARALGWDGCLGALRPRAAADVVGWSVEGGSRRRVLEALTSGVARVEAVWIDGQAVLPRELP